MSRLVVGGLVFALVCVACGRTEVGVPVVSGGASGGQAGDPSGLVIVSQLRNTAFDDTRPFVLAAFSARPFDFPGARAEFEVPGCRIVMAPPADGGVFLPAGTLSVTTATWSKTFDAQTDRRYVYREEGTTAVAPPVVASFAGATVPAFSATLPAVDDLGSRSPASAARRSRVRPSAATSRSCSCGSRVEATSSCDSRRLQGS